MSYPTKTIKNTERIERERERENGTNEFTNDKTKRAISSLERASRPCGPVDDALVLSYQ